MFSKKTNFKMIVMSIVLVAVTVILIYFLIKYLNAYFIKEGFTDNKNCNIKKIKRTHCLKHENYEICEEKCIKLAIKNIKRIEMSLEKLTLYEKNNKNNIAENQDECDIIKVGKIYPFAQCMYLINKSNNKDKLNKCIGKCRNLLIKRLNQYKSMLPCGSLFLRKKVKDDTPDDIKDLVDALDAPNDSSNFLKFLGNDRARYLYNNEFLKFYNKTRLEFIGQNITDNDVSLIVCGLKHKYNRIQDLNLGNNQIGVAGAKTIADALKDPYNDLRDLYMYNNQIGNDGARYLAEALKHEKNHLTILNLDGCEIGDSGAQAIADALEHEDNKLISLNLGNNQIKLAGVQALTGALEHEYNNLIYFDLYNNEIGDTGAQAFADALTSEYNNLTHLNLGYNKIGDSGAEALKGTLEHEHNHLEWLNISNEEERWPWRQATVATWTTPAPAA